MTDLGAIYRQLKLWICPNECLISAGVREAPRGLPLVFLPPIRFHLSPINAASRQQRPRVQHACLYVIIVNPPQHQHLADRRRCRGGKKSPVGTTHNKWQMQNHGDRWEDRWKTRWDGVIGWGGRTMSYTLIQPIPWGEAGPALSITTSIIKIVVGPISRDVLPWIVNDPCRHFHRVPLRGKVHSVGDRNRADRVPASWQPLRNLQLGRWWKPAILKASDSPALCYFYIQMLSV